MMLLSCVRKFITTLQYHLISSPYPEISLIDFFFFPVGANHSLHLALIFFVLLNLGGLLLPPPLPLTLHAPFLMTVTFGRGEAVVYRMSYFLDFIFFLKVFINMCYLIKFKVYQFIMVSSTFSLILKILFIYF